MSRNGEQSLHQKILLTCREMLVEEGYKHLSMRKIARNVGVSPTSIYLHFESKDHLMHTLMDQAINDLNTNLDRSINEAADPLDKLRRLAGAYIQFAMENPQKYQIIFFVKSDRMSRYPRDKFRRARRGYEMVEKAIRESIEAGRMWEAEPRVAAYVFWAQLHGVTSAVLSGRLDHRLDREQFFNKAIEQIIRGFSEAGSGDTEHSVNSN